MKRNTIIIASLIGAGGLITWFLIKSASNKKEITAIYDKLGLKQGISGTAEDLKDDPGFDPQYAGKTYQKEGRTVTQADVDKANSRAARIKTAIIGPGARESQVLAVFKELRNKIELSFMTLSYNRAFKSDMYTDLDDEWLVSMKKIQEIVNKLPTK